MKKVATMESGDDIIRLLGIIKMQEGPSTCMPMRLDITHSTYPLLPTRRERETLRKGTQASSNVLPY